MASRRAWNSSEAGTVALARALSKLGILLRAEAIEAIIAGRVRVDGRLVRDPACRVAPERARILVDGRVGSRAAWRTIAFHKPRGVITTRRDPQGRRTVYDVLGAPGDQLIAVGRLDRATSGLLLLTSDTQLAAWITDPANDVSRVYVVTVRGRVQPEEIGRLTAGIRIGPVHLQAHSVELLKTSSRESHLVVELREGRNREVRRLCEAVGHEVTRLKRVRLGGLELANLEPGRWRELTPGEIAAAFPGVRLGRDARPKRLGQQFSRSVKDGHGP